MCIGIALYGVAPGQDRKILEMGFEFFQLIGLDITGATTPTLLDDGDHLGDFDIDDIELEELSLKVAEASIQAFALYHEDDIHIPWRAAFHNNIDEFGSFRHISIQVAETNFEQREVLADFILDICSRIELKYAIQFFSDKTSSAWNYALGSGTTKVNTHENVFRFAQEIPELRGGEGRYAGEFLRMVYPINIINSEHCRILIEGRNLREWIEGSTRLGEISPIANDLFLWKVSDQQLDHVNDWLGQAGKLISWQRNSGTSQRQLP